MALDAGFTGAVGAGCANDIDASMARAIDNGVIPGPRFVPSGHELSTTGHANDANPWYWDMREWGAAAVLRRSRAVPRRGARRDQARRRDGEAVRHGWPRGEGAEVAMEMTRVRSSTRSCTRRTRATLGCAVTSSNKEAILTAIDAGVDVIDHADEMDDECIERMVGAGSFVAPSCYFPTAMLEMIGAEASVSPHRCVRTSTGCSRCCPRRTPRA